MVNQQISVHSVERNGYRASLKLLDQAGGLMLFDPIRDSDVEIMQKTRPGFFQPAIHGSSVRNGTQNRPLPITNSYQPSHRFLEQRNGVALSLVTRAWQPQRCRLRFPAAVPPSIHEGQQNTDRTPTDWCRRGTSTHQPSTHGRDASTGNPMHYQESLAEFFRTCATPNSGWDRSCDESEIVWNLT